MRSLAEEPAIRRRPGWPGGRWRGAVGIVKLSRVFRAFGGARGCVSVSVCGSPLAAMARKCRRDKSELRECCSNAVAAAGGGRTGSNRAACGRPPPRPVLRASHPSLAETSEGPSPAYRGRGAPCCRASPHARTHV